MITVFTTTYNREKTLERLYNSLINQSNKNFEWLIVDDGSTDNTKIIVENFINEKKINIRYYYQKNGGKHRAINFGIKHADGELFFIVDSDDYIEYDAIKTIINDWKDIKNKDNISGITYRKFDINKNKILGKEFQKESFFSNHIEISKKYGDFDKAEIFNTKILKKYEFPEFKNEKFVPEGFIWTKITLDYKMKYVDKVVYYCEYLEDGYTKNFKKNFINNPKGFRKNYLFVLNRKEYGIVKKIKSIIRILQTYYYQLKNLIHLGSKLCIVIFL